MLAEVLLRFVTVAEVYVAVVPETVVTVALVKLPLEYVAFVPDTVAIVAEVAAS
jgi:hypothetical protein